MAGLVYSSTCFPASPQTTDTLAREVFSAISTKNENKLKSLILTKSDLSYLMNKAKDNISNGSSKSRDDNEMQLLKEHIRLIDNDPHFAMSMIRYHRIILSLSKIRIRGKKEGIDWKKAYYIKHEKLPKASELGVPNVSLKIFFSSKNQTYVLNLKGALKTSRGWSISDSISWNEKISNTIKK